MEQVSGSSLLVEKFRPRTIKDLILPDNYKNLFLKFIEDGDISNIILAGGPGVGKSSTALALCNDLKADKLFINASMENSIDTLRYKVQQFAMTSSFCDGKKIVILDESDRISQAGSDSIKGLIEQTEANCRFILTTNNLSKIIDPIKSRCQIIDFNFNQSEVKNLVVAYFKRLCYILDQEKVKYDKKVLAEFVQKMYPDFRKTLNELQKFIKMNGEVSEEIFKNMDGTQFTSLIEEIKNKKFNSMRKIVANTDPIEFIDTIYKELDALLEPTCIPDVICLLGKFATDISFSVNKELTLAYCCTELMKTCRFK